MKEEWRDIPQYEGLYQVSNQGQIRSIDRIVRRNGETTKNLRGIANRNQTGEKNGMFGKRGSLNPNSKKVLQYDLSGQFIREYDSVKMAAEMTHSNASSIARVANGYLKQTNSFIWRYK